MKESIVVARAGGGELSRTALLRLVGWASGVTEAGGRVTPADIMRPGWGAYESGDALYITCPSSRDALALEEFLNHFGPRVVPHWQGVAVAYRVWIAVAVPIAGNDDAIVHLGPFPCPAAAREYTRTWNYSALGSRAFEPSLAVNWYASSIDAEGYMPLDATCVTFHAGDTVQEVAERIAVALWG